MKSFKEWWNDESSPACFWDYLSAALLSALFFALGFMAKAGVFDLV
jgi:hypothetical protein